MVEIIVVRQKRRWSFLPAAALCGMLACGIFSPRDSEKPNPIPLSDPLQFASIPASTKGYFKKLTYEDLFTDNLRYIDNNSTEYNKGALIGKLNQIPLLNSNIKVVWYPGIDLGHGDTINLNGVKYKIYKNGITSGVPDDSGTSQFIIIQQGQDWLISFWFDSPAHAGKSFFAP